MVEKVYRVPDVSCEHCVRAITDELTKIDGVERVSVDIPTKLVTVQHGDAVSEQQILDGIEEAGYEVAESA
jgi:copper chaperone